MPQPPVDSHVSPTAPPHGTIRARNAPTRALPLERAIRQAHTARSRHGPCTRRGQSNGNARASRNRASPAHEAPNAPPPAARAAPRRLQASRFIASTMAAATCCASTSDPTATATIRSFRYTFRGTRFPTRHRPFSRLTPSPATPAAQAPTPPPPHPTSSRTRSARSQTPPPPTPAPPPPRSASPPHPASRSRRTPAP